MSVNSRATPCFTPGTLIATDAGAVPVEQLKIGQSVVTRDNGLRRVYWLGQKHFAYTELDIAPALKPVLIRAGALGQDRPFRDMIVSPGHRMLVPSDVARAATDEPETLVAAALLVGMPGITRAACLGVSYVHFLCDQHQVVLADGSWTESFHPDDEVIAALGLSQRSEIISIFPEVVTIGAAKRFPAARHVLDEEGKGGR